MIAPEPISRSRTAHCGGSTINDRALRFRYGHRGLRPSATALHSVPCLDGRLGTAPTLCVP
jgi:hypothetical protein